MRKKNPKRRIMKAAICNILLIAFLFVLLTSCGGGSKPLPEAEILENAERLLEESLLWNELFYISGIPTLEDGKSVGKYREADPAFLNRIGMHTLSEIREYGRAVFSPEMNAVFDSTLFGAVTDDHGAIFSQAVCFDYTEKKDGESVFVYLAVNPEENPRFHAKKVEYLYDTLRIEKNANSRATLTVTAVGTEGEDAGRQTEIRINLIRLDGVWYLDNQTFTTLPD